MCLSSARCGADNNAVPTSGASAYAGTGRNPITRPNFYTNSNSKAHYGADSNAVSISGASAYAGTGRNPITRPNFYPNNNSKGA